MSIPPSKRRTSRFVPFAIFFLISTILFVGGSAAMLYLLFSEYSGVRNIWLLLCGAPVVLVVLGIFAIFSLYTRFGRPLEELFNAIHAVEAGNLTIRVTENKSDMFSELFKRFNKMVDKLERAEQQRRNLTADIAHELRTPLHIIQGNLEGVLDGIYQPTPEHMDATLDETRLLTRLVNDLQTLSLAETGQLPLHPTQFLLDDLIQDLVASFSAQATTQGIDLQTNLMAPQLSITADYDRLDQVLSNLIANALQHTPAGGSIVITTQSVSNAQKSARIIVRDSGRGIAPEELPFIFDRFWRGDKSRHGRAHSGLGLAIAKQLIVAHNGTIVAQSELEAGTTFIIELPLQFHTQAP
ncbi:MAG: ATP-binding protein [Anaerolineaceae bacterium]|jgi:two-component system OmpR family sensor kinase/two-component system sensor histidine kinase BaeS